MKRFEFHLEQVLRWRNAIAALRKSETMACAKAVQDAEREVERLREQRMDAGRHLAARPDGSALATYPSYLDRSRREIANAVKRVEQARIRLKGATEKLVEADRNAKLLEKMKETRFREWCAQSDRELEAFAAESFLNRRRLF